MTQAFTFAAKDSSSMRGIVDIALKPKLHQQATGYALGLRGHMKLNAPLHRSY